MPHINRPLRHAPIQLLPIHALILVAVEMPLRPCIVFPPREGNDGCLAAAYGCLAEDTEAVFCIAYGVIFA